MLGPISMEALRTFSVAERGPMYLLIVSTGPVHVQHRISFSQRRTIWLVVKWSSGDKGVSKPKKGTFRDPRRTSGFPTLIYRPTKQLLFSVFRVNRFIFNKCSPIVPQKRLECDIWSVTLPSVTKLGVFRCVVLHH